MRHLYWNMSDARGKRSETTRWNQDEICISHDEDDAEKRMGLLACGKRVLGEKWMARKKKTMEIKNKSFRSFEKSENP